MRRPTDFFWLIMSIVLLFFAGCGNRNAIDEDREYYIDEVRYAGKIHIIARRDSHITKIAEYSDGNLDGNAKLREPLR